MLPDHGEEDSEERIKGQTDEADMGDDVVSFKIDI